MSTLTPTMDGSEVKTLRRKLHMTQEDMARELGVTVSTVNRWENGHTRPSRLATAGLDRLAATRAVEQTPINRFAQVASHS
jgi:DNA-binding transcriptional regulator YiaG